MKKILLLTVLAFLMARLFCVDVAVETVVMTACWVVGTVILYRYLFSLIWRAVKAILHIFERAWDFLMYRL